MTFWEIIWFIIISFVFVAYLIMLFKIIGDIFRDRELHGVAKAIWLIALIFVPFVTAIAYVIARGHGMAEREHQHSHHAHIPGDYARPVPWSISPTTEIAKAKELMDAGVINESEFEAVKAKALASEATTTAPTF